MKIMAAIQSREAVRAILECLGLGLPWPDRDFRLYSRMPEYLTSSADRQLVYNAIVGSVTRPCPGTPSLLHQGERLFGGGE